MKRSRCEVCLWVCLGVASLGLVDPEPSGAEEFKSKGALSGHTNVVYSVAFSPDNKTLVSGSVDRSMKLWNLATKTEQASFKEHAGSVFSVAYDQTGKTLASGSGDNAIRLWNVPLAK